MTLCFCVNFTLTGCLYCGTLKPEGFQGCASLDRLMQMASASTPHSITGICCCMWWTRLHHPVTAVVEVFDQPASGLCLLQGRVLGSGQHDCRRRHPAPMPPASSTACRHIPACRTQHTTLFAAQGMGMTHDRHSVAVMCLLAVKPLVLASCSRRATATLATNSSTT